MVEPESIIGQYLLALDRMNTRSDMFDIQFQIIESLIACERGISHANDKPFVLARDFVIPNAPPEAHSPGVGVELLRRKEDLSKALLLQFDPLPGNRRHHDNRSDGRQDHRGEVIAPSNRSRDEPKVHPAG